MTKHEKRARAVWDEKAEPKPPRAKTDHAVAVAYAAKGWGKYKSRESWQEHLRYKGAFTL